MIERFLRTFPYLKPVNTLNLYARVLEMSNGNLLFLYNKTKDNFEIHSLRSFNMNGESMNASIPEDAVNGWLIHDIRANDIRKFGMEVKADRELTNSIMDNYENRGLELLQQKALTTVEKMIGRDL